MSGFGKPGWWKPLKPKRNPGRLSAWEEKQLRAKKALEDAHQRKMNEY